MLPDVQPEGLNGVEGHHEEPHEAVDADLPGDLQRSCRFPLAVLIRPSQQLLQVLMTFKEFDELKKMKTYLKGM